MLEARAFVSEIESARKILDEEAYFKGEYICRDAIYISQDPSISLADEFLRLRVNEKNIWKEKDVILAIKQTKQKKIGKDSIIPLKKEFDTEEEAKKYIAENFHDRFKFDFQFTRLGWQYDLEGDQVDLEKVENVPTCYTIEVKSSTDEGLQKLLDMLGITSVIAGPSVVEIKRLLI
jgi:hypothetical protein